MSKKTVVVGASPKRIRYSNMASEKLKTNGHEIVPLSIKQGELYGEPILDIRDKPSIEGVDTLTMYIGPQNQPPYYDYLLNLNPKRIIFNPGSENQEFIGKAMENGIEVVTDCTLVMLASGRY